MRVELEDLLAEYSPEERIRYETEWLAAFEQALPMIARDIPEQLFEAFSKVEPEIMVEAIASLEPEQRRKLLELLRERPDEKKLV